MHETAKAMAALARALKHCRADGIALSLWWRDDDVTHLNGALTRLLSIARDLDITVALAVIPALADPALPQQLGAARCDVVQHGLRHLNYSPAGTPKSEFGADRDLAARLDDLARGHTILTELFGTRFLPILAPPWNRIDAAMIPRLPGVGLQCLSGYSVHVQPCERFPPYRMDVQIDLYDWDRGRSLDLPQMLRALVERIRVNRARSDAGLVTIGMLTHHQAHDSTFAREWRDFISLMLGLPDVRWASARSRLDGWRIATERAPA